MNVTRKEMLFGLGATSVSPRLSAVQDLPLIRVGITTDTHFGRKDVKGVEACEAAWNLFKRHGCQVIANCGDIADKFYPKWYEEVCRMRSRVFGDLQTAPKEIWVYAGHDRIDMPDDTDKQGLGNYALLKKMLKIPHEAYDSFSMAGFEFLVVPSVASPRRYEEMLSKACSKTPGKPVFVFDHHPGRMTTEGSEVMGDWDRLKMLSKFPQVVHLTGHSHGSLYSERNIHQGAYTSVSAGCLTYFTGAYTGTYTSSGQNRAVLILEVHADYAIVRRYSILTGDEIGADEPWTIRWPYDPKKPFYSYENMRDRHPPATFPAGAVLSVSPVVLNGKWFDGRGSKLSVRFPETGSRFTWFYRLEAYRKDHASGRDIKILQQDIRGEYCKEPKDRTGKVKVTLDAAYFTAGEPICIKVTPCDFWGGEGKPLTWRGIAPADDGVLVCRGELADGQYVLPPVPQSADGEDVKVVVDAEFDQPGVTPVCIGVKPCDFWWAARMTTPLGRTKLTYIFTIYQVRADRRYEFSFAGGIKPWTVRFSNLRIIAMPKPSMSV